ncbi:MAG TPA: MoxR family ATPase [Anaerolineae bacterium]|jgi:MoxR-like ATPase|nr:MoxR family ATPase [Anaerolineae bacterium]
MKVDEKGAAIDIPIEEFSNTAQRVEEEIQKVIVGQAEVIRGVIIALIAEGHVLLEGVPGLGKTMLIRTLGQVLELKFSRVQFTPDLMPADIVGTNVLAEDEMGKKTLMYQPGPIFANLVLADEVNRATPKTQSALLEAMQERSVTVGTKTRKLDSPFFVMATQNPLEMEGTYPLPEAQLDRFFFKLLVPYPEDAHLIEIMDRTTTSRVPNANKVVGGELILNMGALAKDVPVASHVAEYGVKLMLATHPEKDFAPQSVKQYVRYGSSPRGAQALFLAAKIRALLEGRYNVAFEDFREVALPALRHRVLLNYEAVMENITSDTIIRDILESVQPG